MSMDVETLTITPNNRVSSRRLYYFARDFTVINVLLCIFVSFIACKPSFAISLPEQLHGNVPCGLSKGNHDSAISEAMLNDLDAGCIGENPKVLTAHSNICANSELFCFTSTLRRMSSERFNNVEVNSVAESYRDDVLPDVGASQSNNHASNSSWSSDRGMSVLVNGRTVVCSLSSGNSISELSFIRGNSMSTVYQSEISSCRGPLRNPSTAALSMDDVEMIKSGPDVEVSPPVLDWGKTFLYGTSMAFITVTNNWKDRILHVYQPISFDTQFFPCNFTEAVLRPDEVLSICFVFLPKSLGLSSAHLILQTSSGGFLVQAKGYAVDSPYGIQPLLGSIVSSSGSWRKNLSLFNPFDESISVEEITIWLSTEQGACQIEATCSLQSFSDPNDLSMMVKDWFLVRTSPVESSLQMALRLHRNWEVAPQDSVKIVELDFSFGSVGKVLGAFCMQLTRLSQLTADIIVVPIEVEIDDNLRTNDVTGFITVSLERLANSGAGGGAVAISLRNSGESVLAVLKISDIAGSGSFHIKYMEGLLLFPGTVTRVAIVTCAFCFNEDCEFTQETSYVDENCKLLVQTNDSTSRIEIPCQDILHLCNGKGDQHGSSKHQINSLGLGDKETLSSDLLTSLSKGQVTTDFEEMILRNWIAQGSDTKSSVLDGDEVFFSTVPIGSHHSKWITVHNPSQHPVIMQLLLNSGEIIDNCKDKINGLAGLVSSGRSLTSESSVPIRDGFSLAEGAITEAIVHPFNSVSLGPLIFYPSKRCEWKSSILVRNNLSGVEWFPVRGMGGSQALAIFEGARPAREIEFELKSPNSFESLVSNPTSSQPCSRPLTKVLSIVNSGDLTLEVRRIRVSGMDCGSGGFVVQNCSYFSIQPGESAKLPISYQSKFLAPLVRGDLELALASGIFILPLKATIPIIVMGECRRTLFWSRAKKIFAVVLVAAPCAFLLFCYFYPRSLGFCALYCLSNGDGETIPAVAHKPVKSSKVQYSKKYSRFTSSAKAKHMPSLVIDDKALLLSPDDNCVACEEHGMKVEKVETQSHVENLETMFTQEKLEEEEDSTSRLGRAENYVPEEPILPSNLTILVGKEKGRRRRKRKGPGPGLSALIEVSSSHSGNSTPSSPQSPVSSTTSTPQRAWPKPNDVEQCLETHKAKSRTPEPIRSQYSPKPTAHDQPAPPLFARPRTVTKPVLLPSATFPASSHHLSSTVRLAPHARAPGSRLCAEIAADAEDKSKKAFTGGKEFTYDIWGDHFSAIKLIGKGRYRDDEHGRVSRSVGVVDSNDSDNSFFVKGPQALLTKYRPGPSSYNEK